MPLTPPREILLRWLLATACFAALIFFFSPSWGAFRLWSRIPEMHGMLEVRRGESVLAQLAHPGVAIADPLHAVIQWRLFFPVLGHLLHLPPAVFFALADVGCLLVLFQIITLLREHGVRAAPRFVDHVSSAQPRADSLHRNRLGWFECSLGAVTLGAASWFFTSTGWLGYFDSWLALGLLLVAFGRSRWTVWLTCLATPWIDERFVIALPLALLCRGLWLGVAPAAPSSEPPARPPTRAGPGPRVNEQAFSPLDRRDDVVIPALLALAFLGVRFGLLAGRSDEGATWGGYFAGGKFLDASPGRMALGIWDGLRAGWFFVGAGMFLFWGATASAAPRPKRPVLLLIGAVLATAAIGLATAQDYSRSMTMVLPAALLGLLLAACRAPSWFPLALRFCAAAALFLPAHHVMNDRVNPIFYLYHELAALRSPPPTAMPELYELRAIHAMERGEYNEARDDLTLAIKLSRNPSSPAKQRGILSASQGRWSAALADFSTMVEHDAENPEAWFMRAQARLALGDLTSARADVDRALKLAPEGWSRRPDVTRFLAKVNQGR